MYFLIDVVVVILALLTAYAAFRRGLAGLAGGAFVVIFRIAFVLGGAFLLLLLFQAIGVVDALTNFFVGIFGQTEAFAVASIAEKLASWPNILATFVALIPSFILSYLIFGFLFRYLEKLTKKISVSGTLGFVDTVLGIFIAVTAFFIFYAILLAIVYSFANHGGLLYLDEVLRACPLTGLIYKNNAFVSAIDDMGITAKIMNAING